MITIYHNPRCRKSREALEELTASGLPHEIRLYLQNNLSQAELKELLKKLGMNAESLIRKGEAIWKSDYKGKDMSEADFVQAMLDHPKLMERPVLSTDTGATVGRPIENVKVFLENLKQD